MFIKRNRRKYKDREYVTVLLVEGQRVPAKRKPGRPRKGDKPKTVVRHRTLANLTKLPAPLIELIERYCQAEREGKPVDGFVSDDEPVVGPAYGPVAALAAIAKELGIERALGSTRWGRLALLLVIARVIHGGSRLSTVRWARHHAIAEALGIEHFDEDDLYEALDWLAREQRRIERALAGRRPRGTVYLYDVTSSYLEGQCNELAAMGYNRDGKRYKKQIVVGLLTDAQGEPVSVQVYEGNTSDPQTVGDQVRKLAEDFGSQQVVLVGDRGMIKAKGQALLREQGFHYITSLTDPQIRKALSEGTLQLDLFDEELTEVQAEDGRRYILRRNPAMAQRAQARRRDQLAVVQRKVDERNAFVARSPRARPDVSLKMARRWLATYKLDAYVEAVLTNDQVELVVDERALQRLAALDGCYALVTDVPREVADTETVWERYGDLQKVERDFRTMKTTCLQLRPIYVRKATRTRGHVFVTMLALKIVRYLEQAVRPLGIDVPEAIERLQGIRLVTLADPALGLWRLPSRWLPEQKELLDVLPTLPPPLLSRTASAGLLAN